MIVEKLRNMVMPKKNIHSSTWKVNIEKIARQKWENGGGGRRESGREKGGEKVKGEEKLRE